jgi:hypothetical protein
MMQRKLSPEAHLEPRWLMLVYHVPSEPSSARSAVWRETRRLGALGLQHGVCLLPLSDASRKSFQRLVHRIAGFGGDASILETASPDAHWHRRTIARFNAARDEEYAEVIDEAERFRAEIEREKGLGKYTFAELEDEDSNLERLKRYLAQVESRDTLGAPNRGGARAELEACVRDLERFSQEIYERNEPAADEDTAGAADTAQLLGPVTDGVAP